MTDATPGSTRGVPAAVHSAYSLGFALVFLVSAVGLARLPRTDWMENILTHWEVRRFKSGVEHCMNRGCFLEFEDRMILKDLPSTEFPHGGTYFFGSSPMKWALMTWELTPEQRRRIHNFGIGATSYKLQSQFIHYLAEHRGMLDAGPKAHIVIGAYYTMGQDWKATNYYAPLWERYDLYRCDDDGTIHDADCAPWQESIRMQRANSSSFLRGVANRLARAAVTASGMSVAGYRVPSDPAKVRELIRNFAEPSDWQGPLESQINALDDLSQFVRSRRARFTVVMLPQRRATFDFPFTQAHQRELRALCAKRGIPLIDLSELLSEDEFADLNHSNYAGIQKTHAALMALDAPAPGATQSSP